MSTPQQDKLQMATAEPSRSHPGGRLSWRLLVASGLVAALAGAGYLLFAEGGAPAGRARRAAEGPPLASIPFDGQRAYGYLQKICELGPRPSGSQGMQAQQKLLVDHFTNLGGKTSLQHFRYRHPLSGSTVPMANVIVQWHPERKQRILFCAHYDTRPFPDRDPVDPRGVFLGANDGASGAALLMEMAHYMPQLGGPYGVDFVLFDGEEFVFDDNHPYFLGAEYFSRDYVANPPPYRYRYGVLFDMVADADLQLYQERNSLGWPDTRPLVEAIWKTAARLDVPEFIPRPGHEIRDDHLKLHNIAKIPTCDIIDFDYPAWHTRNDVPSQCSAASLAKVGWVALEWLRSLK